MEECRVPLAAPFKKAPPRNPPAEVSPSSSSLCCHVCTPPLSLREFLRNDLPDGLRGGERGGGERIWSSLVERRWSTVPAVAWGLLSAAEEMGFFVWPLSSGGQLGTGGCAALPPSRTIHQTGGGHLLLVGPRDITRPGSGRDSLIGRPMSALSVSISSRLFIEI